GTPTSQHEFEVPPTITCSAEETVPGGAQTVTYACAATGTRATCPDGATEPTLSFNDVTGSSGVITVTNTFPTPMSDPEPAPEVVVAPAFTG
ncbi:MAG TPA: hypothetical protein VFZ17_07735, partial [Acidimicrobiia bacterium]|nr:hypothetical protein [Acidimicrobiia bacterium]